MIPKIIKRDCLPVICVIALMLILIKAPTECHGFEIAIDVAPNTLNIQSQGTVVTVHTSITYGSVDHDNVYLNEIQISSWKADSRGYFVAKFLMSQVKALADTGDLDVPGDNTLSLVGYTTDGTEFTGSQVITVIDVEPAGAGGQ
ncbi:MAG: hypothetical protein JRE64_20550 [Deltaproteobacteria bacterium]|nr:hypothetical protein [Deltaproteobacteria bacterium]